MLNEIVKSAFEQEDLELLCSQRDIFTYVTPLGHLYAIMNQLGRSRSQELADERLNQELETLLEEQRWHETEPKVMQACEACGREIIVNCDDEPCCRYCHHENINPHEIARQKAQAKEERAFRRRLKRLRLSA